jgi:hypothetical protein
VVVFGVLGGRHSGPSLLVHYPTLLHRVDQLPDQVEILVFVEGSLPDPATIAQIDEMLGRFEAGDALVCSQPVSEAVKMVNGDRILRGVDRSSLLAVRGPELIRRRPLEASLSVTLTVDWVNPTALIAAGGGEVRVFPPGSGTPPIAGGDLPA